MSVYNEHIDPRGLAIRLAGYIKDPSTIRVRVLDHFGRAPSIDEIRKIQGRIAVEQGNSIFARKAAQRAEANKFKCSHPSTEDNRYVKDNGRYACKTCRRELEAKAAKRYREKKRAEREAQAIEKLRSAKPMFPSWYVPPTNVRPRIATDTIQVIADAFRISYGELVGGGRQRIYIEARTVAAMIFRKSGMSYPAIGRLLNRDHSSIMNLCEKWHKIAESSPMARDIYARLESA